MNSGRNSMAKAKHMIFIMDGRVIQNKMDLSFKCLLIVLIFSVFSEAMKKNTIPITIDIPAKLYPKKFEKETIAIINMATILIFLDN